MSGVAVLQRALTLQAYADYHYTKKQIPRPYVFRVESSMSLPDPAVFFFLPRPSLASAWLSQ